MSPANLLRWFYQSRAERRGPSRPGGPGDHRDLPRPTADQADRADPRAAEGTPPAKGADGDGDIDWDFLWIDLGGEG
jgi:hypothetical protein